MQRSTIVSIIISLLTLASGLSGQEPPNASMIDEFGYLNCEDILVRTFHLATEIHNDPGTTVAIIIFSPNKQPGQAEARRHLISSTLQLQSVERDRFNFFSGGPSPDGEIRIQFWKQPLGASPPAGDSAAWNEPPHNISRPFMYGYSDETDICPTFVPKAFAQLLAANPGARGKVLVTMGNGAIVNKYSYAAEWIRTLVEVNGIPRKRLRLVFSKGAETGVEFWFVPARKDRRRRAAYH